MIVFQFYFCKFTIIEISHQVLTGSAITVLYRFLTNWAWKETFRRIHSLLKCSS